MNRLKTIVTFLLLTTAMWATIPVGQWRTHFSYEFTDRVIPTNEAVFAVADGHVYSIDPATHQTTVYSKVDGWSENKVQCLAYCAQEEVLVNVYANANVDLVYADGTVYNLPEIKDKNWVVDKTVYQIFIEGHRAYLATGFGVVVLNLHKREVEDTYIIGEDAQKEPIYGFTADSNNYYALSASEVYVASKKSVNLSDFQEWHQQTIQLPASNFKELYTTTTGLYAIQNGEVIWQYAAETWSVFYQSEAGTVSWCQNDTSILITGGKDGVYCYTPSMELVEQYPIYAVAAAWQEDELWVAAGEQGAGLLAEKDQVSLYKPSGMPNVSIKEMSIQDGKLMVSPGGYWLDRYRNACQIPYFDGEKWNVHTTTSLCTNLWTNYVYDVTSVAMVPDRPGHFYFTTWGEGLFEVKDNKVQRMYNESNTQGKLVSSIAGDQHYVRLDGALCDEDGNVWLLNAISGIKMLTPEGQWHTFNYSALKNCPTLRHLIIQDKYKWCVNVRNNPGIFVFSDQGTYDTMADDKSRFFSAGTLVDRDGKTLSPTYVFDIAAGTDNNVWAATDIGPIVFNNLSKIFDNSYRCTRVKIDRNDGSGLADYLLDGVTIQSIAIDAGNRKWLGTANVGVYLLSADGKQTIHHFNSDNSPLSSNEVSDIAIDETTGEVYIATADGLFSYRSDAMEAVEEATTQTVYAFPNPVRPEYGGLITIAGLEENSKVWITDASAGVVFEGMANGGSLSWDGRNASGQMVSGGVYFVLVSNANSDHHRSLATKILIVR